MYLCRIETVVRTEDISDPWAFRYSEILPKKTVPVVPSLYLTSSRCSQQFCLSNRSVYSEVTPRVTVSVIAVRSSVSYLSYELVVPLLLQSLKVKFLVSVQVSPNCVVHAFLFRMSLMNAASHIPQYILSLDRRPEFEVATCVLSDAIIPCSGEYRGSSSYLLKGCTHRVVY